MIKALHKSTPILMTLIGLLLFLAGCNSEVRSKRAGRVSQVGQQLSAPAMYPLEEFNLAYTICKALRTKNTAMRAEYLNNIFHFEVEHIGCSGDRAATTIRTTLTTTGTESPLMFSGGPNGGYFSQVTTHAHGQLATVCRAILEGQSTSNSYQSGDETIQVRFQNSDVPKVMVYTAKTAAEGLQVIREDHYHFQLGVTGGSNIQGLEQEHRQLITCPNGAFEVLRQTFLYNSPY